MIDLDTLIREADPARDLAVPEVDPAEIRRLSGGPPRSWRRLIDAAAAGAAVAVALGVALIVLVAGVHNGASPKPTGNWTVPGAARPLTRLLAVLRRPQTAADRAAVPNFLQQNLDLSLVRLAARAPWGERVVFAPVKGHPYDKYPYDTLGIYVMSGSSGGRRIATASQIEAGHAWSWEGAGSGSSARWRLIVVVPDGVAKVAFSLAPEQHFGSTPYPPPHSAAVTVPVHNNLAFVQVKQYCCGHFPVMRWYAPDGRLIKATGDPTGRVQRISAASGAPVKFVAGGNRELAHGKLPGGQSFTIIGERYRFEGRLYLSLAISVNRPGTPPGGGGGGSFNPSESPGVLAWTGMYACAPPYAVVYGLLRAPSDSVRVRKGHRTTVLRHAAIPAPLHAGGVLVYASLAGPPDELIVRGPDGRRVLDNKLSTSPTNCQPPRSGASR